MAWGFPRRPLPRRSAREAAGKHLKAGPPPPAGRVRAGKLLYGRFCRGKRHPRRWPRGGYALAAPMAERLTTEVASFPLQTGGASMANDEHVAILRKGVTAWNAWRSENFEIDIDPDLSGACLSGADLHLAHLGGACLIGAHLNRANLGNANLTGADLTGADLRGANLRRAYLHYTVLRQADLTEAKLEAATLVGVDLAGANLTGCRIHGISAWGLKLEGTKQRNLVITTRFEPEITVDNIEVAQFIYLMLHNQKIREVIDTITSKAVLILGRFTDERKAVLDALREELRKRNYLPILFDFEKPRSRDTDETITLLARMVRFIVADISDAKAVLQELRAIVPDLPSVPVQPIILAMQEEPGMFDFYRNRPSFLAVHHYASQDQLLADLGEKVIRPAERKVLELRKREEGQDS